MKAKAKVVMNLNAQTLHAQRPRGQSSDDRRGKSMIHPRGVVGLTVTCTEVRHDFRNKMYENKNLKVG